ncbi:MAG: squalene synthase HpnC, partial [Betaproteobacteria bacterium]
MPVAHYENFPVASVLLPRRLRLPVESIYWFARSADDIADEGDHPADWRLAALDEYRQRLDRIGTGAGSDGPHWGRLAAAIADHELPLGLFHDLLDAFAQDVRQTRYATFADVEAYCRRSANPVGRLLLHLFGAIDARSLRESDAICTSLQLLNFCQDVAVDWKKDRIYFPLDEMAVHNVGERHFALGLVDSAWQRLFDQQLQRALMSLRSGNRLPDRLHGRCALE